MSMNQSTTMSSLPLELSLPQVVPGGKHISYYVAIGAILVAAWVLQSRKPKLPVPFYKAAKTKWMFDAETLIRDSYAKVSCSVRVDTGNSNIFHSFAMASIRSKRRKACKFLSPRTSLAN